MRRCLAFCGLLLFLLGGGATTAEAHVIASTGYSTITQDGPEVGYLLSLEYGVLARAVDLGPTAADDAEREQALLAGRQTIEQYLDERVVVSLDGAACEPALRSTSISSRAEKPYADLALTFTCAGSAGSYRLQYKVFEEAEAVADDHTNLVEYDLGGESGRTVLDRNRSDFTAGETSMLGSSV